MNLLYLPNPIAQDNIRYNTLQYLLQLFLFLKNQNKDSTFLLLFKMLNIAA